MMIASDAAASMTLVSVMAPTPRSMTRRLTSSPTSILTSASSSASTEPEPSPLRIRLSWLTSPSLIRASTSSRVIRPRLLGQLGGPLAGRPPLGDLPRDPVVGNDEEVVAGAGDGR